MAGNHITRFDLDHGIATEQASQRKKPLANWELLWVLASTIGFWALVLIGIYFRYR